MRKLKDRIEDNELDLSLNELSEVPVQELAEATKAIYLDLSCNKIAKLPDNFATLTHLVKLDLNKNLLTELPYNFGNLVNLQYLDLYGNQLTTLPLSVYRLKALKWLDLKNNPLGPELKPIAGDCLDQKQCQECAVKVVSFMQSIESEIERQKQIKLKEEREKEAVRKRKEEKELEKKRRIKKAERERRKAEAKVRKTEEQNETNPKKENEVHRSKHDSPNHLSSTSEEIHKVSGWARFLGFLVFSVLISASAVIGLVCYRIHSNDGDFSADNFLTTYEETKIEMFELVQVWWHAFAQPYFSSLQRTFHEWIRLIIKE